MTLMETADTALDRWRQQIWVTGQSLRRLIASTNLKVSGARESVLISGVGRYFPEMEGADWIAGCCELKESDAGLSDIRPLLDALISESSLIATDAPRHEFAAFMRGAT
jgi:hypothetical protein